MCYSAACGQAADVFVLCRCCHMLLRLCQVYPYHLSDYVCRVVRVTPFRYYSEVLFLTLKEEKSYDRIPNFTVNMLV